MEKKLKIGDVVGILNPNYSKVKEDRKYIKHRVVSIVKKSRYNMYICEHLKTKTKSTITDIDLVNTITVLNAVTASKKNYISYKNEHNPPVKFYKK